MIEKIRNMSNGKRNALFICCILGTLLILLFIWCDVDSTREKAFKAKTDEVMTLYGSAIDHYTVDSSYIGVYVKPERWNNSDKETRDAFMHEICVLTQANMKEVGIERVDVAFRVNDERVGFFEVKAK